MRKTIKFRFALAVIIAPLFFYASIREIINSCSTGVAFFPVGRRSPIIQFSEQSSPFGFYATLVLYVCFALAVLIYIFIGVRALLRPNDPFSQKLISQQISSMEERYPSGLKPLWYALAIFATGFAIYVLFGQR